MKKILGVLAIALLAMGLIVAPQIQARDQAQNRGDGWPSANLLKEYGLEGITQPVGAKKIWWRIMQDGYGGSGFFDMPVLYIGLEGTASTEQAVKNWFGSNGWTAVSDGSRSMPRFTKSNVRAGYDFSNVASGGSNAIIAGIRGAGLVWASNAVWDRFGLSGLTLPSGAIVLELRDDGGELGATITGGKAAYNDLVSQLTAKMGKGRNDDGQLAFWNEKTQVVVYISVEGEEVGITVEKR